MVFGHQQVCVLNSQVLIEGIFVIAASDVVKHIKVIFGRTIHHQRHYLTRYPDFLAVHLAMAVAMTMSSPMLSLSFA